MMIKVAVNGFGRIGRMVSRLMLSQSDMQLVAINDVQDVRTMAHLFKFDSIHGKWKGTVESKPGFLLVDGHSIPFYSWETKEQWDWTSVQPDVVIECTGKFKSRNEAMTHVKAGANRVIISAPPSDDSISTVVLGVNEEVLVEDHQIISNASCTTNNAAPMIAVLRTFAEIESCYITTIHSYTGDQKLQDGPHIDWRRGRAAAESIVPTTTGAAKALTRVFPDLSDKIGGCGIRVPVPDGSLTDITIIIKENVTIDQVNAAFREAAEGRLKGILSYSEDALVSRDIIGNAHSCIFDAQLTSVIGKMVKVVGWYDNEIGYSNRLVDLIRKWN